MKRIVHFGPVNSKGGMSAVINLLTNNDSNNFIKESISTHCDGNILKKIKYWIKSYYALKLMIKDKRIDVAHFHVTHSLSWFRKWTLMRLCWKSQLPFIVHIHSGKFDVFCKKYFGLIGNNVKKTLVNKMATTVVLEERWLKKCNKWIPNDSIVINNPSEIINNHFKTKKDDKISILMLARNSEGKGHKFAIDIIDCLISKGKEVELFMTGFDEKDLKNNREGRIKALGWITKEKKYELIKKSRFLIHPSNFEGSSMSIIEAISNGLPAIVSSVSKETIGINELVLDLDDPEKWAKKIILLDKNKKYEAIREKMKLQAERFSLEKIDNRWEEIYQKITY